MPTENQQMLEQLGNLTDAFHDKIGEIDVSLASHQAILNRPADHWTGGGYYGVLSYGSFATMGNHAVHMSANGYRTTDDLWMGLNSGGHAGASQIECRSDGYITFRADAVKVDGSHLYPTDRMSITPDGALSLISSEVSIGAANIRCQRVTIANDASYTFAAPGNICFAVLVTDTGQSYPGVTETGTFAVDCGLSPSFFAHNVGSDVSLGTETTPAKINVDAPAEKSLRVTNKLGVARSVSLYMFGGEG